MQIKSIQLSKSKTLGIQSSSGRTNFKKIQISLSADITNLDNPDFSYKQLSSFIDEQFIYEQGKKI